MLWTGAGFSRLGAKISVIAFPLLLVWHGDSALGAGLVAFAGLLPVLLLQLPAGVLVDHWDRRRLVIGCDALAAVAMLSVRAQAAADRAGRPAAGAAPRHR